MVEDFIQSRPPAQQEIFLFFHGFFLSYPGIEANIRYTVPFYSRNSWITYLSPKKNDGVELVFILGQELSNQYGILDARGRKQVSGTEVFSLKQLDMNAIEETWLEALMLDEERPYRGPRNRAKG